MWGFGLGLDLGVGFSMVHWACIGLCVGVLFCVKGSCRLGFLCL